MNNNYEKDILNTFLKNSSDAVIIFDKSTKKLKVNPAFERLFGWTEKELVKHNLAIISDELSLMNTMFEIEKGKTVKYDDVQRVHKNGNFIEVSVTVTPIQDPQNKIYGAMAIYRDSRLLESMINKLEESQQKYASLYINNIDAIFSLDLDGKILNVNEVGEKLVGARKTTIVNQPLSNLLMSKESKTITEYMLTCLDGHSQTHDIAFVLRDGEELHCVVKCVPMIVNNELLGIFLIIRDITNEHKMHQAVRDNEIRIQQLLDFSPSAMFIHVEGVIKYANQAAADLLEIKNSEQLIGKSIYDFHPVSTRGKIKAMNERLIYGKENIRRIDEKVITINGKEKFLDVSKIITTYKGERAIHSIANDISHRKKYEEKVKKMAYHDPLTGLPNRRAFEEHLKSTLEMAEIEQSSFAVMYIDCDNFKPINDDLGHDVGDEFLKQLAKKLESSVREGDIVTRIGGDEFNVLLKGIDSEKEVVSITKRIMDKTNEPFQFGNQLYDVTSSIGISIYCPDNNQTAIKDIVKRADKALYIAKEQGKNTYHIL
nr:diguanylate cyclase [Aquibacillus albus]